MVLKFVLLQMTQHKTEEHPRDHKKNIHIENLLYLELCETSDYMLID